MTEGAKPGDDVPMAMGVNTTTETKEMVKPDANGEGVAAGKKVGESVVESVKEVKEEEAVPPSTKDLEPGSTKEEGEEKKERSEDEEDKTRKI